MITQRGRQLVRLERDIVIPAGTVMVTQPGPSARQATHVRFAIEVEQADVVEHDGPPPGRAPR